MAEVSYLNPAKCVRLSPATIHLSHAGFLTRYNTAVGVFNVTVRHAQVCKYATCVSSFHKNTQRDFAM